MHEPVELKGLVYDNTSGAREIAQRALQFLQRTATASAQAAPASLLDELVDVGVKIVRSKPEMAQVLQALNRFVLDAEALEAGPANLGEFRIALVNLLSEHLARLQRQLEQTARNAQDLLKNGTVVLTHSRSSSVLQALRMAKQEGKLIDVVLTESRPLLEGRQLARELAEDQIPVRLVVDTVAGTAVPGCDRVLLGADSVTQGGVVNKSGSSLIALAAREAGVPVNVLAETGKTWVKKVDPSLGLLRGRLRDPKEVWEHPPLGVEVVNLYFDLVPHALIESLVCEDGRFPPAEFWAHVSHRGYARRLAAEFQEELV